jgi:hypothetical protein
VKVRVTLVMELDFVECENSETVLLRISKVYLDYKAMYISYIR